MDGKETASAHSRRLNYIGCKQKLLQFISDAMTEMTGRKTLDGLRILDAFSGTGSVAFHLRCKNAVVDTNDIELYSSFVSHAVARSSATARCLSLLTMLQKTMDAETPDDYVAGLVEREYSYPRMFFTGENARRIDVARRAIEAMREELTDDEHAFLVASLLVSADMVSNVASVYGCYLKSFKKSALKPITLHPIHTLENAGEGRCMNVNALDGSLYETRQYDVIYVDPPYNERQYSKNYFPLNAIASPPSKDDAFAITDGSKTGIPKECYISPFCRKAMVRDAFRTLVGHAAKQSIPHVMISYSSEAFVPKDDMLEILGEFGSVVLHQREHKRFKSYEYNSKDIKTVHEYMFCLTLALPKSPNTRSGNCPANKKDKKSGECGGAPQPKTTKL